MGLITKSTYRAAAVLIGVSVYALSFGHWMPASAAIAGPLISVSSPTPTPAPSPGRSSTTGPGQSLASLQAKFRQRIASTDVARGRVGVKIVSLATGKVVFENDAEKLFMPASNMKNFTIAAVIERLTPDFKFVTSVVAPSKPEADGVLKGDLGIIGTGDVTISTAFNNGDYYRGIDNLVDKIVAAGVKRIEGSLVAYEGYFRGYEIPQTWEWNDLQWYYGAEVSEFPINDNAVDLKVMPGSPGGPCNVSMMPQNSTIRTTNVCTTSAAGTARTLRVFKAPGKNVIEISGSLPVGDKFEGYVSVSHPAELFLEMLRQRLQAKGITVTGNVRVAPGELTRPPNLTEIAQLESPPLSVIAGRTMKVSQNLYTETLLWTLGEIAGRKPGAGGDSSALGLNVVSKFLADAGVPENSVLQYDGSGLSRHNLVTPSAVAALYRYMANESKYAKTWRDSLSVGGVDGTLSRRFKGSDAAGNFQGKSGTIDQVSALSGYLTTTGGDQLVISIIVNGVAEPRARTGLIDDIVVEAANFNGKIDG